MFKKVKSALFLVLAVILVFIIYQASENGRYQLSTNNPGFVIDTRTGEVYLTKDKLQKTNKDKD